MCIGSNLVNQAQDLMSVTKFEDFPHSLIPTVLLQRADVQKRHHPPKIRFFEKYAGNLVFVGNKSNNG